MDFSYRKLRKIQSLSQADYIIPVCIRSMGEFFHLKKPESSDTMPTAKKLPSGSWRCQAYSHTEKIWDEKNEVWQGAAIPDEIPNAETLEAFKELESGGGHKFTGSTENLFAELMEG